MSRTYRQKEGRKYFNFYAKLFFCSEWKMSEHGCREDFPYAKNSREYLRSSALFHRDGGSDSHNGPHWFINLYCERGQRREARRELGKFLLDQNHEVSLLPKNPLPYWL
jgi:hypothetical protein